MPPLPPIFRRSKFTPAILGIILFCSGLCSLIYQSVWLREFRLVFGGSAPAAAAVVAVFMAGLGFGGAWFGARAEKVRFPLRFYAYLEAGIALSACLTPMLLKWAKTVYFTTGGTDSLGMGWATALLIALTVLVLGLPCFLIGGTLPVAMKFAQRKSDQRRSDTALFYSINVAGALAGSALGTFAMLPNLGNKSTLMSAALLNITIALGAGILSRLTEQKEPDPHLEKPTSLPSTVVAAKAPSWFVLAAAFLSGFTFFVAELVWYRVSTPLLGSTVYGFGLVLCVVLLGMGIGGLLYSQLLRRLEPKLSGFTLVSALQAIFVLLPYALGDWLSYWALVINESLRGFGFVPLATGWFAIIAALVFMPSVLSGIQFPLLISLLGRGNHGVGREMGRAYFWNTVGSISGSLIGGFVLIPMISATHTWVLASMLIAGMSALSFVLGRSDGDEPGLTPYASFAGVIICGAMAWFSTGPTAVWLQSPIGYGRLPNYAKTTLKLEQWMRDTRRFHVSSFDGRDANVAVVESNDQHAFLTNGKSDGSALGDAPTQVMFGLVGAVVHPRNIERCCVIGLGTGSTAGWLAEVPSVKQVDAIEIESRAADIAREFSTVNRHALDNPKVRLIIGDGREALQTHGTTYDLIASEPSNPYRAGVANLYTTELYKSAKQRLTEDGIFCQWLQGYETNPETVKLIIATLCSEFAKVEVWNTSGSDLLFVCTPSLKPWDVNQVRERLKMPVYAQACATLWHTDTAEGFFGHCLANALYAQLTAMNLGTVNTDDHNILEFASARNMGRELEDPLHHIFSNAIARQQDLPFLAGQLDKTKLAYERCETFADQPKIIEAVIQHAGEFGDGLRAKREHESVAVSRDYKTYLAMLGNRQPQTITERLNFAMATALTADSRAASAAEELEKLLPDSRPILIAMRASVDRKTDTETLALIDCISTLRRSPWVDQRLVEWLSRQLVVIATRDAPRNQRAVRQLFDALRAPFAEGFFVETRNNVLSLLSDFLTPHDRLVAIDSWGPHYPFYGQPLATRLITYAEIDHPGVAQARADAERYVRLGGKLPALTTPIMNALLASAPGQEIILMREIRKQQQATASR